MHDFTNTSLLVSGEPSFLAPAVSMGIFDMAARRGFDYTGFVIGLAIGIFGTGSNIINAIIFYRQGLDNTINISFFSLAISDIGSLLALSGGAICVAPPISDLGIPIDFPTFAYFASGAPHVAFANITSWITVYITAERCLCVALPLKVKQIITPRVTSSVICAIYALNVFPQGIPYLMSIYMDWKFSEELNRTIFAVRYREQYQYLEAVHPFILSVQTFLPFPTVIVFTVILLVKLRQQTLWRQKSTHESQKAQMSSKREIKTMYIVVAIAVVLIICYIPGVIVSLTQFGVPGFDIYGTYKNVFFGTWYLVFFMHGVNSSVNMFLYYKMNSKFKKIFHELFDCCIYVPRDIVDAD